MSTQELKFKAIADAIRAKKNTTNQIVANDFAQEISTIESGGGGTITGARHRLIGYDGTVLKEQKFVADMTFDIPATQPDLPAIRGIRPALTFQGYTHLTERLLLLNHPIDVGCIYIPSDGWSWFKMRVTKVMDLKNLSMNLPVMEAGVITFRIEDMDGALVGVEQIKTTTEASVISFSFAFPAIGSYWVKTKCTTPYGGGTEDMKFGVFGINTRDLLIKIFAGEQFVGVTPGGWANCRYLTSANFGMDVSASAEQAFYNCKALTSIILGGRKMLQVGRSAFANCYSLKTVVLGFETNTVMSYGFENCFSLTKIVLGDISYNGDQRIEEKAFNNCSSLADVTVGYRVDIDNTAFAKCISLSRLTFAMGWMYRIPYLGDCILLSYLALPPVGNITIPSNSLTNCQALTTLDLTLTGGPLTLQLEGLPPLQALLIIVPDFAYDMYITATNWTVYKDKIITETDYKKYYGD